MNKWYAMQIAFICVGSFLGAVCAQLIILILKHYGAW